MPICRSCGEENPERARFCLACGTPLAREQTVSPRARKTVTVLFSDIVDSTPLGERLDPETLQQVKSRYFDEVRAVLERHGGTVEKFIGDAVMAVFGIPTVHEDDALRAVRAAAELGEALTRLNDDFARERGVRIAVRTGVNTGEVVAGDFSHGQAFATGDAVNVAARLEQAAHAGQILIGEPTYRLVRDAVHAERVEPLAVKGKADALVAYRLLEVAPGAPGAARRLDSPIVGRERERAHVRNVFAQVASDRACHLFTLLGPAGVGKSRLVEDFVAGLGDDATVVRGRCLPYGEGITFWPVIEVVRDAAGLGGEEASVDDVHAAVERVLEGLNDADSVAERVVEIIGREGASSAREELFWGVRKFFEALAREQPLVVVFDDIHWGEPTFLDLVEHVSDWSRGAPILLVCVARPELLDVRPGWGGGKFNATSMLLEPLPDEAAERLIGSLLGGAPLPAEVRDRIIEAAEGNPLFVEEMVAMLTEEGTLVRMNGSWRATRELSAVAVPPTIQALLAARLDRLEADERAVIQRAAVEGKVFHRGAVTELLSEDASMRVEPHLMSLLRKELIRPDRSAFPGDDAFRFRHLLIRDAAYESLPKATRAELHERVASWLAEKVVGREVEYDEILGYHLEQAYRYRAELGPVDEAARRLADRAAERLIAAGERAIVRGDDYAAARLRERAVSLVPVDDPARIPLAIELAMSLWSAHEPARAIAVADEARAAARAAGDRVLALHAEVASACARTGGGSERSERMELTRRAEAVFTPIGDDLGLSKVFGLLAWRSEWETGSFAAALDAAERGLAHALAAGHPRAQQAMVGRIAATLVIGPTPAPEALRRLDEVLERGTHGVAGEAEILAARAQMLAFQGDFDGARSAVRRAHDIYEDLGLPGDVMGEWGAIERLAGDLESAQALFRDGLEKRQALGLSRTVGFAVGIADALCARGAYQDAVDVVAGERPATPVDHAALAGVRARALAGLGRVDEAIALAEQAVRTIEQTDALNAQGDALVALGEVLQVAGREEAAERALREAVRRYQRKGNIVSARKAERLLDERHTT